MTLLEGSIDELRRALAQPTASLEWRGKVRRLLRLLDNALEREVVPRAADWQQARVSLNTRERERLRARIAMAAGSLLERPDGVGVRRELRRLLTDLEHHVQRTHDLIYDALNTDLGGSE